MTAVDRWYRCRPDDGTIRAPGPAAASIGLTLAQEGTPYEMTPCRASAEATIRLTTGGPTRS